MYVYTLPSLLFALTNQPISGGGMPISQNRTKWPVTGGAVGVQPGWFPGHSLALIYINLGEGSIPRNYSLPMVPVFQMVGPNNDQYEGSFCLPQVPLPKNFTAKVGDNATIQIVETAQHGAALYNVCITLSNPLLDAGKLTWDQNQCVDITFAPPEEVPEVNETNCVNSTNMGFELVFSTDSLSAAGPSSLPVTSWMASMPFAAAIAWSLLL